MLAAVAKVRTEFAESTSAQTFAVYIPLCWLVLQVTDVFVSGLGLPHWVFQSAILLLTLGFAVLLTVTYVQRRRQTSAESGAATQARGSGLLRRLTWLTRKRAAAAGAAVLLLWLLVVLAYMASRAFGIGPAATLLSSGKLQNQALLVVSNFDNRTDDPHLAQTVAEAISLDLSQSKRFRIMESNQVSAALERMEKPEDAAVTPPLAREIALREGAGAIVQGSVSALGPATVIRAKLVSPSSGETIADFHVRADEPDELLSAVDELSGEIRAEIGESLVDLRKEPPLAEVTTSSLPALKLYSKAARAQGQGDRTAAIGLLERALALDADFPMAWRKLGALLRRDDPVRALNAYTRAYMFRDRLPEREQLLATASYQQHVQRDLAGAAITYQTVLESFASDYTALNNLANIYTTLQRPEKAEPLQQRLIEIEKRFGAISNLFNTQIRLGKISEARETHELAKRHFPENSRVRLQPVIIELAESDYSTADRLASMLDDTSGEVFLARYFARRGRFERAISILRKRIAAHAAAGESERALDTVTTLVAILRLRGDMQEARLELDKGLAAYPLEKMNALDRIYWDVAEAAAVVGDSARAKRFVQLAQQQNLPDSSVAYDRSARVAGLIAFAEERHGDAIAQLRKALRFGQCANCMIYDLGLALEAAGDDRGALDSYSAFLTLAPRTVGRSEQELIVLERAVVLARKLRDRSERALADKLRALSSTADPELKHRLAQVASSSTV